MQKKIRFGIFIIDLSFLFLMYLIIETTQPRVSSRGFLIYSLTLLFFYVSLRGFDTQRIGSPRWTMTSFSIALFLSLFLFSIIALFLNNHLHMDAWGNVLYFLILTNVFNPFFYHLAAGRKKELVCVPKETPECIVEELMTSDMIQVKKTDKIEKNLCYYQHISSVLGRLPQMFYEQVDESIFEQVVKSKKITAFFLRIADLFLSTVFIVILSPFFLICSLLLLVFQGRPILYKQTRIGKDERPFTLYKFRTLAMGEAKVTDIQKDHENRSTGIGKFLRSLRLDELPQLINCIRGDMSLVGPRPEMPYFHHLCKGEIPNYSKRLIVKPGITGWAQTMYKRSDTLEEYRVKTGYDFYFLLNYSIGMYVKSLLYTLDTLVYRKE